MREKHGGRKSAQCRGSLVVKGFGGGPKIVVARISGECVGKWWFLELSSHNVLIMPSFSLLLVQHRTSISIMTKFIKTI